jgi:S1-C subfamily serine protease
LASTGILVAEVGGRSRRSGLRPGDLILTINGRAVSDVDALVSTVRRLSETVFEVDRKGRRGKITVGG